MNPRSARFVVAFSLAASATGCGRTYAPPKNVLLVSVDTLRRDHLELYGYARRTMPHVTALAAQGITFDDAITPLPKTAPSLSTLMTGLYPQTHGVRVNVSDRLDAKFTTLAEVLRDHGFRTGAVVSNQVLVREQLNPVGLDQGFETYDDALDTPEGRRRQEILERRAKPNTDAACAWLRANANRGGKPWFFWVHYIDPHGLYDPPEPYRSRWKSSAMRPIPLFELTADPCCRIEFINWNNLLDDLPQNDMHHDLNLHLDRYDGEIAYADDEIGRLLSALDESGRANDTLVVFVADHGESFGEHGIYFEHGYDVFDENVRIPLVMRSPTALPAGRRVSGEVQIGDVLPTVLDLLGLPIPRVEGQSLVDAARGTKAIDDDRTIPIETNEGRDSLGTLPRGVRAHRWKCVITYEREEGADDPKVGYRDLFDLERDPGEQKNLFDPNDARSKAMESKIVNVAFPTPKALALQAIGYAGGKSLVKAAKAFEAWHSAGGAGGAAAVVAIGDGVFPTLREWIARETDAKLLALEGESFRGFAGNGPVVFLVDALRTAVANGREANEAEIRRSLQAMPPESAVASVSRIAALDNDARMKAAAARVLECPALRPAIVDRLAVENESAERRDAVVLALCAALAGSSPTDEALRDLVRADHTAPDRDTVRRALAALQKPQ